MSPNRAASSTRLHLRGISHPILRQALHMQFLVFSALTAPSVSIVCFEAASRLSADRRRTIVTV